MTSKSGSFASTFLQEVSILIFGRLGRFLVDGSAAGGTRPGPGISAVVVMLIFRH